MSYTANLCQRWSGVYVPFEITELAAITDVGAVKEAERWASKVEFNRDDTFFVVKNGARGVCHRPPGTF
jgi:hypothetical protein